MASWAFQTPYANIRPMFELDGQEGDPAYDLFKFYRPMSAGVNVYQLNNGTFVQDYPTEENSNTNIPWPDLSQANTRDANGNLIQPFLAQAWGITGPNGAPNVTTTYQSVYIIRTFLGGHNYVVDDATAAALTAAGYTVTGPL